MDHQPTPEDPTLPSGPGWAYYVINRNGNNVNIGLRIDTKIVDVNEKVYGEEGGNPSAGTEAARHTIREDTIRVLQVKTDRKNIHYLIGHMMYKHISSEGVNNGPLAYCMHIIKHTFNDTMFMLELTPDKYNLYEVKSATECTGDSTTCDHCRDYAECEIGAKQNIN